MSVDVADQNLINDHSSASQHCSTSASASADITATSTTTPVSNDVTAAGATLSSAQDVTVTNSVTRWLTVVYIALVCYIMNTI